jgi:hypothetical protein
VPASTIPSGCLATSLRDGILPLQQIFSNIYRQ